MYLQGLNGQLDEKVCSRINTKEIEKWNTRKGNGQQQETKGHDRFAEPSLYLIVKVDAITVRALAVHYQTNSNRTQESQ